MDVEIGEVVMAIKAVDNHSFVSPEVLRLLVQAVLRAVEEKQAHTDRVHAERRVTGGVSEEREREG